jgi:hypothetical protein
MIRPLTVNGTARLAVNCSPLKFRSLESAFSNRIVIVVPAGTPVLLCDTGIAMAALANIASQSTRYFAYFIAVSLLSRQRGSKGTCRSLRYPLPKKRFRPGAKAGQHEM